MTGTVSEAAPIIGGDGESAAECAETVPARHGTQRVQRIRLAGRLGGSAASEVRDRLHAAVDGGRGPLVLDVTRVETVDGVGLGVLVGAQRRAARAQRRLVLRGTPPRLRRFLRATGLERILPTENHDPDPPGPNPVAA